MVSAKIEEIIFFERPSGVEKRLVLDCVALRSNSKIMLTDSDLKKLEKHLVDILRREYKALRKDIKNVSLTSKGNSIEFKKVQVRLDEYHKTNSDGLKAIKDKLDEFLDIIKHLSREQKILIKKMREIEKYFDPPGRN